MVVYRQYLGEVENVYTTIVQIYDTIHQHGQKKPERPKLDYATLLSEDTGLNLAELGYNDE